MAGAVYLNGSRVRIASKPVFTGAEVKAMVSPDRLFTESESREPQWAFDTSWIVFEDDGLLVLNKPSGLPTQPTVDEARANLYKLAMDFIKARDGLDAYLGLHHRLDRDTSGLVLFTKKKEMNLPVAELFAEHQIQKTYVAVVEGEKKPEKAFVIKNYLGKLKKGPREKIQKYGAVKSGGDFAETSFELIRSEGHRHWLTCQPKTGRTHQIRAHLSEAGYPILGDFLYGRRDSAERLMLHAWKLEFIHPVSQKKVTLEAPLPTGF